MTESDSKKRYGVDGPPQLHGFCREMSVDLLELFNWSDSDEDDWTAEIVCACGENARFLIYQGEEGTDPGWRPGRWGHQLTDLKCAGCGLVIPFFYEGFHGYNAVVCGEREQMPENYVETNRAFLRPLECEACGKREFGVGVFAVYDDDDLREGFVDTPVEQWDDAYGWFQGNAKCASCSTVKDTFVGHETA